MTVDNTEIYRALVSRKLSNGKVAQVAYGPQASKAHAQDYGARYRKGPTRVEKQVLTARYDADPIMSWETIDTKYTNGGEDVEWDD